ncbi:MAG: hypothetical protein ACTSQY_08220 [Candidatus Odinarchaeia archaeon]
MIRPDVINYIGADRELTQTKREVDLKPEETMMSLYLEHIHQVAQLPPKEFLEGAGKTESGVALQIVFKQFENLINDMSYYYKEKEIELVSKLYYFETGKELADFNLSYMNSVTPSDKKSRWDLDKAMYDTGVITLEELKGRWA